MLFARVVRRRDKGTVIAHLYRLSDSLEGYAKTYLIFEWDGLIVKILKNIGFVPKISE
jgi:hypothetical protein